jgi:GT2 family glycosyltransferase
MLLQEDELILGSDLVLTTSHFLNKQVKKLNSHCLLIPNGADYEHFHSSPLDEPLELSNFQQPVIGYFGAIADWFDTDLLQELAYARPEWQFILIGSTLYADLAPLEGLSNISLLGEKPYALLPSYLHKFDVAIIPFKKMPLTEATNPVKLFEYLSAGKPVVATDLDELRYYADYVRLANTSQAWLEALDAALDDTGSKRIQARQEFAQQNNWAVRFAQAEAGMLALFPTVSVIVLTYNNLDYTRQCLRSILEKTIYPNYEIIVVDNASSDDTPAYLQSLAHRESRVKVHLNTENVGFAAGNNQGAGLASGEILIFLNNDTIVPSGWMFGLVNHVQDPDVGMVGPVTNWSGNETRIDVPYQTVNEMDTFAAAYITTHHRQTFEISLLPFLCVALRRSVFDEIGPLDEQFGMGMFEDDDYARRVYAKGYRIICAEDVFVHHWGSASFSRLEDEIYKRIFNENRRKLEAKWGIKWTPHKGRYE